jgi:hypothetical protein
MKFKKKLKKIEFEKKNFSFKSILDNLSRMVLKVKRN